MKTEELRSLQAPLKEQYRERPEAALVTLRAERVQKRGQAAFLGLGEFRSGATNHFTARGESWL